MESVAGNAAGNNTEEGRAAFSEHHWVPASCCAAAVTCQALWVPVVALWTGPWSHRCDTETSWEMQSHTEATVVQQNCHAAAVRGKSVPCKPVCSSNHPFSPAFHSFSPQTFLLKGWELFNGQQSPGSLLAPSCCTWWHPAALAQGVGAWWGLLHNIPAGTAQQCVTQPFTAVPGTGKHPKSSGQLVTSWDRPQQWCQAVQETGKQVA